ncbi:MAG TPA: 23S rRNA (pseudouridine(1915)-N(3))-methyltransferase RlmH [Gammaproteobacteria bacterium]|nr:23S rRNA (pseudouridine(1915)-N(3))-methyltransferase RlmH [Gammaproteobacteria bacterium]
MNITILSIGNKMPSWIQAGYEEYAKRLSHDHKINLIELSKAQDMLKKIPSKNYIIGLDEKGLSHNTQSFAHKLESIGRDVTFLIGAADGLDPACKEKADILWSLSPLTFPHMLVRVILIEQLYRAFSLLKNHPYHRE